MLAARPGSTTTSSSANLPSSSFTIFSMVETPQMVNHARPRPHVKTPPIFLLFFQFPKNRPAGSVKQKIKLVWPNGGKEEYTTAIIRWIGGPGDSWFGVEIKVGVLCHGRWVVEGNVVNVPPPVLYRIGLSKCPHLILLSHSPWGKRQCA